MKSFNEIYEEIYRNHAISVEKNRKSAGRELLLFLILDGLVCIFLLMISRYIYVILAGIGVFWMYYNKTKKMVAYTNNFKNNVIKTLVKEYDKNLCYSANLGVSSYEYREAEFEYYSRFNSEDLIQGKLAGEYDFIMSEVHTEKEIKIDGKTSYETVFHGLFAKVKINKLIESDIIIKKNIKSLFQNQDRIEMDSGEFEKKYNVYSANKITAMQILTSDLMQLILDFIEENKIVPEIKIKKNTLYIRFETGNTFEPNILKEALDYDTIHKYYNMIKFNVDLIEKIFKNIQDTEI